MANRKQGNSIRHYYTGCPMWANKHWQGSLFTDKAKPKDYLAQYSAVLNTVEGNHTFYALPKRDQFMRWKLETPESFRFCLKFPKTISHVYKLQNVGHLCKQFFDALEPLGDRIGLLFLQLPPSFDKSGMRRLEQFITALPGDYHYAVEFRHLSFFDGGETENALNMFLEKNGVNRVLFDTQTLHGIQSGEAGILAAQKKKPKMPGRFVATAGRPMLRFVGHPQPEANSLALQPLAAAVAGWIRQGRQPYVFMHTPDGDKNAPELCRLFHKMLQREMDATGGGAAVDLGEFPPFANDRMPASEQLTLF